MQPEEQQREDTLSNSQDESFVAVAEDDFASSSPGIDRSDLYAEIEALNGTVGELEDKIRGLQRQINQRDQLISEHKREIVDNSDLVMRLRSEKRVIEGERNSLKQSLESEIGRSSLMAATRMKMEQSLSELEEGLLNEKRQLQVASKNNRKFELDIRSLEGEREDLERRLCEMENVLRHKDENMNSLKEIIEEKSVGCAVAQRRTADLQADYDELEQRLEAEKEARMRSERKSTQYEVELREMAESLEESGRVNASNSEMARKREGELEKLRFDMRELAEIHETTTSQLKQKHQAAVEEMGRQIDEIYGEKARLDKEVHELGYKLVISEGNVSQLEKEKEKLSALNAQMEASLEESNGQVESLGRKCDEQTSLRKKLDMELRAVSADVEEYRNQIGSLLKAKQLLQDHLENARHQLDEEDRAKVVITAELRNAIVELESVKTQLEVELETRGELEKELVQSSNAVEQLRKKYENERFERMREMEEVRSKYEARLAEAEDQIEQSANKSVLLQRSKEKLQQEVEDLVGAVDKANTTIGNLERRQKRFDRLIEEWKQKCESISMELAAAQNHAKYMSTEANKKEDQYMEAQDQIESLRRENRNLSDEVRNLMEQIEENAANVFDFEKAEQKLEKEKNELRLKIDDCLMEKEESELRFRGVMNDMDNLKTQYELTIKDLQDDVESAKKNYQRMVEMMQANVDAEISAKREALAQKDNALTVCDSLSQKLETEEQFSADLKAQVENLRESLSDVRNSLEDEKLLHEKTRDAEAIAGRRIRSLVAELDHSKENALAYEKTIEGLQLDLNKLVNARNELQSGLRVLDAQKAHVDGALARLQLDHQGTLSDVRVLEERCGKLSSENNCLTEKLALEQKLVHELDSDLVQLRRELGESENKLEMAESNAFRSCKARIQGLEDHLLERDNENQLLAHQLDEAQRAVQRADRKMRDSDKRLAVVDDQNSKLRELNETLQLKMKSYRKQSDAAEQEASHCLAKFKAMADDLIRAEQRLEAAESMVAKYRAASRCGVFQPPPGVSGRDRRSVSRNI